MPRDRKALAVNTDFTGVVTAGEREPGKSSTVKKRKNAGMYAGSSQSRFSGGITIYPPKCQKPQGHRPGPMEEAQPCILSISCQYLTREKPDRPGDRTPRCGGGGLCSGTQPGWPSCPVATETFQYFNNNRMVPLISPGDGGEPTALRPSGMN